jgi:hypothetical protein
MATVSQITNDAALESHLLWDQYKNTIIAVVAVLLLGAIGYTGFQFYHERRTRPRFWRRPNRPRIINR